MSKTTTDLSTLKINYLSQEAYDAEKSSGTIEENEIYLTPSILNPCIVGQIIAYAGANEPLGWLKCDGQAVSRTTYSALFSVIGTTYGSGNGSTTFNLPDLKGRTIVGVDPSDTSSSEINFSTLGSKKGSKYFQSHNHVLHGTYLYAGSSGSAYSFNTYTGSNTSTENAGGGDSQNIQPSIVLNYLIYVGTIE